MAQQSAGEAMEKKKRVQHPMAKEMHRLEYKRHTQKKKAIAHWKPRNPPARKTIAIITL